MIFIEMIRCSILFVVLNLCLITGIDHWCDYWIKKSDEKIDICSNEQCVNYVDPQWILVRPLDCKTNSLALTFSTFQTYEFFLNNIQWNLSDLFPSKKSDEQRILRIFLEHVDEIDRPIDEFQLNRLGNHLDLYYLYIRNVSSNHSIYPLLHFSSDLSSWKILQIQFNCHSLVRMDEYICSTKILPPNRYPSQTSTMNNPMNSSLIPIEENARLIHLIMLIAIPILMLFIIFCLSIFLYRKIRSINPREKSSSIYSISQELTKPSVNIQGIIPAYQVSRLPSPHEESLYREN